MKKSIFKASFEESLNLEDDGFLQYQLKEQNKKVSVNDFQSNYNNDSDAAKLLKGNSQMVVGDDSTRGKMVSAKDVSEEMDNYFRRNPFREYSFDSYTSWRNTNDEYFADLVGSK